MYLQATTTSNRKESGSGASDRRRTVAKRQPHARQMTAAMVNNDFLLMAITGLWFDRDFPFYKVFPGLRSLTA